MNKFAILAIVVIYLSILIVNYPSVAAMSKNGSLPSNGVKSSSPVNTGKKNESKRSVKNIEKPASSPKVNVRKQPVPTTPKNKATVKDIGKTIQSRPKTNKSKQKSFEKKVKTTQRFPEMNSGNTKLVQIEKGIVKIQAQIRAKEPEKSCREKCNDISLTTGEPCHKECYNSTYGTGFIVGVIKNTIYIITVSHVVDTSDLLLVSFYRDPTPYNAELIQRESDTNGIALLSVTNPYKYATAIQQLQVADDDDVDLERGDSVAMAGYVMGSHSIAYFTLSYSGRDGRDKLFSGSGIQGISGSPIIRENKVVGMVTANREGLIIADPLVYKFLKGYSNGVLATGQQKKNTISSPLPTPSVPILLPKAVPKAVPKVVPKVVPKKAVPKKAVPKKAVPKKAVPKARVGGISEAS